MDAGPPILRAQPWLRVAETFDEILRTIAEAQISPRQCLSDAISGYETEITVLLVCRSTSYKVTSSRVERDGGSRDHLRTAHGIGDVKLDHASK